MNSDDPKLSGLLRGSRGSPPLPPRFQQNVWRRIEDAEAPVNAESWLAGLTALILRPRFAFAIAAVLLFAGGLLGTQRGSENARHDAQTRYLAEMKRVTLSLHEQTRQTMSGDRGREQQH